MQSCRKVVRLLTNDEYNRDEVLPLLDEQPDFSTPSTPPILLIAVFDIYTVRALETTDTRRW